MLAILRKADRLFNTTSPLAFDAGWTYRRGHVTRDAVAALKLDQELAALPWD